MNTQMSGLVVCGTDTDVGKTIVSSLIVQGLDGIYWKPVQSGIDGNGDTGRVCKILELKAGQWVPEAYRFQAPVSPHWAAEKEQRLIDAQKLKLPKVEKPLIVETAGGLMVPLTRELLQIDQLITWQLPVVLVARTGLGTLNHTLLSLEALRKRNIKVLGVFLNGSSHQDNPRTIRELADIPIIGRLPILETVNALELSKQWQLQKLEATFERLLREKGYSERN